MNKTVKIFWTVFLSGFGLFVIVILLAMLGVFGKLPSLKELENPSILQSSEVFAADGTLMGKYYRERGNRSNVSYQDISPHVINALIATEDERFMDHSGIDLKSTMRAVFLMGREGGGSTISQQLAKTLLDQGSKSMPRRVIEKFKEYIVAVRLERNFTKEEIISLYLNAVPYGDNVYGIRNAARTFFQKEPDRLNVEEAAVLVGMLKGNYIYNPRVNPKAALDRRNVVLGQMEKYGVLSEAEVSRLKSLPIKINYKKLDENTGYAPYFREILKDEVKEALKERTNPDTDEAFDIYDDGLRIYTTINPKMQQYAEEAVAQQMPMLQKALNRQNNIKTGSVWKSDHGRKVLDASMRATDRWKNLKEEGLEDADIKRAFNLKVPMKVFAWNAKRETDTIMTPLDSIKYHRQMLQTAFMVMDPITGEVRAWVGGINFKTFKFDHANINTKRQVGSSIKPLLYCQAMEERGFTPETAIPNQAQNFGKDIWVPAKRECPGLPTVSLAGALAHSLNCASAYLMKQVGPAQFAAFMERVGIKSKFDVVPSLALGSCDISLYEMMQAYSIFPGHGFSTHPVLVSRIEDRNGNVIYRSDIGKNRQETVSEVTAYNMTRIMQGTVDRGTAAGLRTRLGAAEMGGKTGTTNENADAWFIGYVPQLQGGVWVGSDDRFIRIESAQGYGGTAAMPIWEAFFRKVYADRSMGIDKNSIFAKPADLTNDINSADMMEIIGDEPVDNGQWDEGHTADDYGEMGNYDSIGAESTAPVEEPSTPPVKGKTDKGKDSSNKKPNQPAAPPEEQKKKGGFLKRVFGNKDSSRSDNDY
jgi:penicillin-binding protein 1A